MTESEGGDPKDDDSIAKNLIKQIFRTLTKGKQELVDLHIHEERREGPYDANYHMVPLDRPPVGPKLKLEVTIRDVVTKREITGVTTTSIQGKTFSHPAEVEVAGFPTLPNETSKEKVVKPEVVEEILKLVKRAVEAVISIINALVNFGAIKPH